MLEIIHACGFDLSFVLVPIDKSADQELREALLAPPSERVEWLLTELGQKPAGREIRLRPHRVTNSSSSVAS